MISPIDPLSAVTNEDVAELKKALQHGWQPPKINTLHSGRVVDSSVWVETLMRDWAEGWQLLDEYLPDTTRNHEWWRQALRYGSHKCAPLLWEQLGLSEKLALQPQLIDPWLVDLMTSLGEPWTMPHELKNPLPMIAFLKSKGIPLNGVVAGEFEHKDFRIFGHSLWTRSLLLKKWDLVHLLWPEPADWALWPRLNEVLLHVLEVIVGDYKPLIAEFVSSEQDIMWRWLETSGSVWLKSIDPSGDPVTMILARPTKDKIAPWLRWPSLAPENKRAKLWAVWKDVVDHDPDLTWLHELAMYPDDEDTKKVIAQATADHVQAFEDHWSKPCPLPNVSPYERWMAHGGDQSLVATWGTPVSAIELIVAPDDSALDEQNLDEFAPIPGFLEESSSPGVESAGTSGGTPDGSLDGSFISSQPD